MRRFSAAAFAFGALLIATAAVRADSEAYKLDVPIDVVLTQPVSSETAQVGDEFYFKTKADVNLGTVTLPAGTPGKGRLATAVKATHSQQGAIALQADNLSTGTETVWVNIDTSVTPRGRYSTKRDIILEPGMTFRVMTIAVHQKNATLVTPPPSPEASAAPVVSPATVPSATMPALAPSPASSDSPMPAASETPGEVPSVLPSAAPTASP